MAPSSMYIPLLRLQLRAAASVHGSMRSMVSASYNLAHLEQTQHGNDKSTRYMHPVARAHAHAHTFPCAARIRHVCKTRRHAHTFPCAAQAFMHRPGNSSTSTLCHSTKGIFDLEALSMYYAWQ